MRRLLALWLGLVLSTASYAATVYDAPYGVQNEFEFEIWSTDGLSLDVDETDSGTDVTLRCNDNAEATATNDYTDEGTTYRIVLTATEMQCELITVTVNEAVDAIFHIQTYGDATNARNQSIPGADFGTNGGLPLLDTNLNVQADVEAIDDDASSASGTVTFPNATLASTTNITGGTITTATNLTNNNDKTGYALSTAGVNAVLNGQGIPDPTTIATLASQTSFTLTAGSADDNAYNGWAIEVRDASTATQVALGCVRDYTGSTRTVTLLQDPAIFTMATTDNVMLFPAFCDAQVIQTLYETALLICTVDTANFAGDSNDFACDLTDRAGAAVTSNMADGDLQGLEVIIVTGAQQYEKRFVRATDWDGANNEMRLNLSRALPATLADNVVAIIR